MKHIQLVLALLLFTICLATGQTNNPSTLYQSAQNKYNEKDFYGAISDISKAISMDQKNIDYLLLRAKCRNEIADYENALKDIDEALKINPDLVEAHMLRGITNTNLKKPQIAYTDFGNVLFYEPDNLVAINYKVLCLYQQDRVKEAEDMINNAIETNPDYADFYYTRGVIQNGKEKYERSLKDFDQAIELGNSTRPYDVYLNRGLANMKLQLYPEALEDFNKGIELRPDNALAYHSRGMVYYLMGNYEESINDFNKTIKINSNDPVAYYNLGMAYFKVADLTNGCKNLHIACSMGHTVACKKVLLDCSENIK
jgi:tetratricopeptide (TPR) repeat protein